MRPAADAPAQQVLAVIFLSAGVMTNLVFGPHEETFSTLGRSFQARRPPRLRLCERRERCCRANAAVDLL